MDRKEYDSVVQRIGQKIRAAAGSQEQEEYYRGYIRGIRVYFQKSLEGTAGKRAPARDASCGGCCVPRQDPYPRGYADGCRGAEPEEFPGSRAVCREARTDASGRETG